MRHVKIFSLFLAGVLLYPPQCAGQGSQAPASPDEMKYLRFVLMQLAAIDGHPNSRQAFEYNLVRQFALSDAEVGALRAAGQEPQVLLVQLRQSVRAIPQGRAGLSQADKAALRALTAQRDQEVEALGNRLLNQVRPQTAAKLRQPGKVLANRGKPETVGPR